MGFSQHIKADRLLVDWVPSLHPLQTTNRLTPLLLSYEKWLHFLHHRQLTALVQVGSCSSSPAVSLFLLSGLNSVSSGLFFRLRPFTTSALPPCRWLSAQFATSLPWPTSPNAAAKEESRSSRTSSMESLAKLHHHKFLRNLPLFCIPSFLHLNWFLFRLLFC